MKRGNESKGTLDRSHWNPGVREKQSEPSVTMSQHHGQRQLVMCRPPVSLCSMMLCLWLGSGLPAGKSPSLEMFAASIFLSSYYFQVLWLAFSAEGHILVYPRVSLLGDQCTFNHMREAFDEGLLTSALILSQQRIFSSNCHTHTHIHVHMPGSVS